MHELIQNNMLAVMSCLFMIFFLLKNHSFENQVKHFFESAICLVLILIVVDAWEKIEAAKSYPTFGRITASVIGYSIRPIIAYFVCRAALKLKRVRFRFLFALPIIINIYVVCSAFFSPIAFSYNAANEFVRGPLGYTPFVAGIIYVIAICYISVTLISKGNCGEAGIILFIVMILALATIIESIYHYSALLSGGSAIGLIFYYLYLNINITEHDLLTGAKMRRNFYLDAARNAGHLSAIISMDLNGLKQLNDEYGHHEGDKALIALAENVRKVLPLSWDFYRTGGDEFMILCYKADETKVKEFICKFDQLMREGNYSAATGYVMLQKDMDFEKSCRIADAMMYEKKHQMKEDRV